jgi:hypothetical protein
VADYENELDSWSLFVHRAADGEQAAELLRRYGDHLAKYGSVLDRSKDFVVGQVGGIHEAVVVRGRYVCGANGCESPEPCRLQAVALSELLEE